MSVFGCVVVCVCVYTVKILSPDIHGLSGRACLHAPCHVLPPLFVSLYLYLSDAQGNWFIFQYGSRSNMEGVLVGWRGQRNLCKHLPGFLTDFWLFSLIPHSQFSHFHIVRCARAVCVLSYSFYFFFLVFLLLLRV